MAIDESRLRIDAAFADRLACLSGYELVSLLDHLNTLHTVTAALLNSPNMLRRDGNLNSAGAVLGEVYNQIGQLMDACDKRAMGIDLARAGDDAGLIAKAVVTYAMEDIDCVPLAQVALSMAKAQYQGAYP